MSYSSVKYASTLVPIVISKLSVINFKLSNPVDEHSFINCEFLLLMRMQKFMYLFLLTIPVFRAFIRILYTLRFSLSYITCSIEKCSLYRYRKSLTHLCCLISL